jgi:predicted transposase YbfD/YdcC
MYLYCRDEITEDNVHKNHLCCKPITAVKDLSINDQKKLIEHDYLTLISLLPMYLGSQGDFQHKIREKTNISHDGALELERLMNDWGSTRLFIGANSHYKTLTQTI